jgi:hypothetical protein
MVGLNAGGITAKPDKKPAMRRLKLIPFTRR